MFNGKIVIDGYFLRYKADFPFYSCGLIPAVHGNACVGVVDSVIKTCDEYIRFAFLTGVTKFSKISIFSDLNNLKDISLNETYAGICSITQQELETNFQPEIEALAEKQQLDYAQAVAALKQWYGWDSLYRRRFTAMDEVYDRYSSNI